MGGILNHLVKEKIYCIDQMYLHEHSDTIYENPLYAKYANVNYPFVILDKQNKPIHTIHYSWRNYTSDTLIDMAIGAPRSIYINNRPTWLELNGDRKRVALSKFMDVNGTSDCLITIYELKGDKNEPSTIPEDVFQVLPYSGDYDAILTPNKKYKLVAIRNGEVIIDKLIELKE